MQHHRCFRIWAAETNTERITNTIAWFPRNISMSQWSPHDTVVAAAYDLTQVLLKTRPTSPVPTISESIHNSLLELYDIFRN